MQFSLSSLLFPLLKLTHISLWFIGMIYLSIFVLKVALIGLPPRPYRSDMLMHFGLMIFGRIPISFLLAYVLIIKLYRQPLHWFTFWFLYSELILMQKRKIENGLSNVVALRFIISFKYGIKWEASTKENLWYDRAQHYKSVVDASNQDAERTLEKNSRGEAEKAERRRGT